MTIFIIHSYTFRSQNTYKQLIIGVVTQQETRPAHAHCSYVATECYKPQDTINQSRVRVSQWCILIPQRVYIRGD